MKPASKGKRLIASTVDFALPIFFLSGVPIGINDYDFLLFPGFVLINITWLWFRDTIFSLGRKITNIKLVDLNQNKLSLKQVLIRNLFLIPQFFGISGYLCEAMRIFLSSRSERTSKIFLVVRKIIYIFIIFFNPLLLIETGPISERNWAIYLMILSWEIVPIIFLILDKTERLEGQRLMDFYAGTGVISK